MQPWAIWTDASGGGHARPLFEDEKRGHKYTGPLAKGETQIMVPDGEYPQVAKEAACTAEYLAAKSIIASTNEPVTRAEFEALKKALSDAGYLPKT